MIEDELGFSIREDLLASLGDVWCAFHSPGEGGLLTGLALVLQVKDRARLQAVIDKIVATRQAANKISGDSPVRLTQMKFGGNVVYYYSALGEGVPFAPAWCLMDKQLVVGLYPQNVKGYLTRGKEFHSLASLPAVAKLLASDSPPSTLMFQNTASLFEQIYPLLLTA